MIDKYLQLRKIAFLGPSDEVDLEFLPGVNVVCGASDTGKSFLAESIDFMLGGSNLREIPERTSYGKIELDMSIGGEEEYRLCRSTSGGDFKLIVRNTEGDERSERLRQSHRHEKTDNLSGFLLDKTSLLGKRILKSKRNGTTQSLSFRNLARLVIVQEGEIQDIGSPFWGGQYISKTAELATIKLLLTGVDDSDVVSADTFEPENSGQITLIDELLTDLNTEIADSGEDKNELTDQFLHLEDSIETQKNDLNAAQRQLDDLLVNRRKIFNNRQAVQERLDEIDELLERFELLSDHYKVDIDRLTAIRESGSLFAHVEPVPCPLCGALPESQHVSDSCEGDVEGIVSAAAAETQKIELLKTELSSTVGDLRTEASELNSNLTSLNDDYEVVDSQIKKIVAPGLGHARASFSMLIEERANVQKTLDLFTRVEKLEGRKLKLMEGNDESSVHGSLVSGIPDSDAHSFSMKVSKILKAWNFPGECHVFFDKDSTDFVIDGKPRGSRGKGLRAITHAAVTIGLLEYCQEHDLPHPGFVVLDSPLLAYFKPEGDDDLALQGTDLKERFYDYLVKHHAAESQVIIIENQHPPQGMETSLSMTVFTGNPNEGRFGFL